MLLEKVLSIDSMINFTLRPILMLDMPTVMAKFFSKIFEHHNSNAYTNVS